MNAATKFCDEDAAGKEAVATPLNHPALFGSGLPEKSMGLHAPF